MALVPEGEDAPVPVGSVAPALIEALQDDLRSEGRLRPWTADASDSVTGWLIEGAPDEGLQWLGITWDAEPVIQSERIAEHRAAIQQLLASGKAY
ncbi:MAG: hypothetical protein EBU07_13795, partial [Betaproteobacteria bacterium]|nr:hypothetical protein [Betaproteobacteria bacterium]